MPNYSLNDLDVRAYEALKAFEKYTEQRLKDSDARRANKRFRGLPTLSFVGFGRAGKDTAAQLFCRELGLSFNGSTSRAVLPFVAHAAGVDEETCYLSRHEHRFFWFRFCNELRRGKPDMIARLQLADSDVLAGVRDAEEFRCLVPGGIVDLHVWIDRRGVEPDPTVEFTRDECELVIDNNGTLGEFNAKIVALARLVRRGLRY